MACDDRRRYVNQPDFVGGGMPPLPPQGNWPALLTYLRALEDIIRGAGLAEFLPSGGSGGGSSGTVPGPIQNFTATTTDGGVLLTWDFLVNSFFFAIFRSETPNLFESRIIAAPFADGAHPQFFDAGGQAAAGTARYYWVRAFNKNGIAGPVSAAIVSADPGVGGGSEWHPLDADFQWIR